MDDDDEEEVFSLEGMLVREGARRRGHAIARDNLVQGDKI